MPEATTPRRVSAFDRWLAMAAEYSTKVDAARAANCAPLELRDQLAGLLRARRAQGRDLTKRGL